MGMAVTKPLDTALLARMTGRLGEASVIEAQMAAIGKATADRLAEALLQATSVAVSVVPETAPQGVRADMAATFGAQDVLCETTIEGWSLDLLLAVDSAFVIAMTERLLGGESDGVPASRPLSEIEQDVAKLLFETFAETLRKAVYPNCDRAICSNPFQGPLKRESDASSADFSAVLVLGVTIGKASFKLRAMVPQAVVLKTKIAEPATSKIDTRPKHWTEQLSEKVQKSNVGLEARIRLVPVSLGTVARLQPGSVIPFADTKDTRVLLRANGKDLFWCELGKSGERYMVRLQERHGSEEDLMKELTA